MSGDRRRGHGTDCDTGELRKRPATGQPRTYSNRAGPRLYARRPDPRRDARPLPAEQPRLRLLDPEDAFRRVVRRARPRHVAPLDRAPPIAQLFLFVRRRAATPNGSVRAAYVSDAEQIRQSGLRQRRLPTDPHDTAAVLNPANTSLRSRVYQFLQVFRISHGDVTKHPPLNTLCQSVPNHGCEYSA